ncbi:hypothetical protein TNCV_1769521 [Trichonephila clavipes]|nr:hypothetical protein TNCV_1769521 [Trichonephila clavipes]
MQATVGICSVHPNLKGENSEGGQGPPTSLPPSTNHTTGLAARRLFRGPPYRKGAIHLQTSMSSLGFEPSPYGTAVSVVNHLAGWATNHEVRCLYSPTERERKQCMQPKFQLYCVQYH